MADILSYLTSIRGRVNLFIERYYSERGREIPHKLFEALNYALFPGGKMLRAATAIGICDEMGSNTEPVLPVASAIELVHTFSLIHDDLPCMDNDDLRRGRETVHKRFSEALALLCGDALLSDAIGMIATAKSLPDTSRVQILEILSNCVGSYGMIGGQVLDMEYSAGSRGVDPFHIIKLKTANMFILSSMCGAICSGKGFDKDQMAGFGEDLGILFQLTDDLLDLQQDRRGSFNIVSLYGYKAVFQEIDARYQKIRSFINTSGFNKNIIYGLVSLVVDRVTGIREAVQF